MSSDGWDDDEKTVLGWLDGKEPPKQAPKPAPKAEDDERTTMMPLPGGPPPKAPPKATEEDADRTVFGAALPVQPAPMPASVPKANPMPRDADRTVFGTPLPGFPPQPPKPPAPPVTQAEDPDPISDAGEWTLRTPLPLPGTGNTQPPARVTPPPPEPEERTVLAPLPMPGKTQPPTVVPPPVAADDDEDPWGEKTVFAALPDAGQDHGPTAGSQPDSAPEPDPEPEDDDRTVIGAPLDWFDPPTTPPMALPQAEPPRPSFAYLPAAFRTETAIQRYTPRTLWTPQESIDQALIGHGLAQAVRRAARRSPRGLSPAQRDSFIREARERLRHPSDAFLDDGLLTTFRQLVATRVQDLAMEELDVEPEMPSGLDPREQQEWRALGKGLFVLLRDLERRAGGRPRIGRNTRLHDRLVKLGQDPFSGMPHAEIARYDPSQKIPVIRAQFIGFFGPFGAFPLNWTEEVQAWVRNGDDSFVAFVDIFTFRFQELFFRAWSDARAITQFDHAGSDRFQDYMLTFTGTGTPAMQERDSVSDTVKARYAGLAGGRVKSPTRLRQMLQLHFDGKLRVEIEELVPTWLNFEPDTLSQLGMQACGMGMNMHLGSRVRSVGEKIRVHLYVKSVKHYFDLLPGGHDHAHLRDLVHWYLGEAYEIETVIWLPQPEIQPAVMGKSAQLGWMACLKPPKGDPDKMVQVTVFKLLPPKGQEKEAA